MSKCKSPPVAEFQHLIDNPRLKLVDAHVLEDGDHDLGVLRDALLLLHLLVLRARHAGHGHWSRRCNVFLQNQT